MSPDITGTFNCYYNLGFTINANNFGGTYIISNHTVMDRSPIYALSSSNSINYDNVFS